MKTTSGNNDMREDMSDNKEIVCALGLSSEKVWTEFAKIDTVKETMEKWEAEGGILYEIRAGIKIQNGKVKRLQYGFGIVLAFLAGLGIVNIPTIVKFLGVGP
jgi:hypothetical protein